MICNIGGCTKSSVAKGMCKKHYLAQYIDKHREQIRKYKAQWQRSWREKHPEYDREYHKKNSERRSNYGVGWRAKNRTRLVEYQRNRLKDVRFRVIHNLRTRLNMYVKRHRDGHKTVSAIRHLGCTMPQLISHLEAHFTNGMSWSNYGNKPGQWSIDHIRPLSSFDLDKEEQARRAVHYTNLQPLWHVDNIRKKDRLDFYPPDVIGYVCG